MSFARHVVGADEVDLFYIPLRPMIDAPFRECVQIIEAHVAEHGGSAVVGWAIWERPKVFIEAEFHMVWRSPGGEHLDLTPRPKQMPRVLFLRDPKRVYRGAQIDNVRKPLCSDKNVKRFLELAARRYQLLNEGPLRYHHGPVRMTSEMAAVERESAAVELKIIGRYGPWLPEDGE